ncbi:hypothetical protein [Roseinatronobacter alkalisoli]|uniref:Uncharacterized protein n=1 Tax=Roseinatronobacter alkalisoli TaxID=3028235 RepID=A0ABT5TDJ9_9RHOB|nr:hypothetical protein [Roseinatronobacter sp. HJB301]MDD7973193.1 hypothetical protein [Roseinatronobacter sp. HJB301]
MPDLVIKTREARAAKTALVGANQALSGSRINPLAWLAIAHRAFHH